MENRRVKPMVEGGILAAIAVAMSLISMYVPIIGSFMALILPLPIIVLVVRHGVRWGIMSTIIAGVLISMLISPLQAISIVVVCGFIGVVLGYTYRKGYSAVRCLTIGSVSAIASILVVFAVSLLLINVNPMNIQMDMMQQAFEESLAVYRSSGMSETEIADIAGKFQTGLDTVKQLVPVTVVLAGLFETYINFIVAGVVLRRVGHTNIVIMPPFKEWKLPWGIVYIYAFSLIGMYWGSSHEIQVLLQTSMNFNMFASILAFIQGLALLFYTADRYQLSNFLRGIILILILTSGLFQVVALIGLFDIIFDYRKRFALKE
ncbi:MAG: Protein of unknown function rane [Massilibacillus sp.]|jgi:uncharacterized protein YybS (DUF2232 family)|nr:Protein of unknown function rane [Massilibacillus sp.]